MIRYDLITISEYLERLARREPVPGGGSAAALSAALGMALIQMVSQYSLGKGKPKGVEARIRNIDHKSHALRTELVRLVSLDAEAYLAIVAARKKDKKIQKKAAAAATKVSRDIKVLSRKALGFLPYLRKEGNRWLVSDIDAAENFLKAAMATSDAMIKANA